MEVDNAPKSAAEEEAPAVADPPTVPKADDAPAAPAAQAAPAAESKEAPAEAKEAAPAKRKRRSPSSSRSKSRSKSRSRSRSSRSRSRSKSKSKSKSKSRSRSRSRSRDKRRRGGRRSRSRSRSPRRHGSSRGSSGKRHDYKREEQERREQKKEFTRARKESEKRSIVSQLSNDDGWRRSVWIDTSKLTGNIYVNLLAKLQKCGRVEWLKTFDDMDVFVAMFDSESASERALKLAADNMPVSQPSKRIEVLTKTSLTAEKLCKLFKAEDSEEVEGNLVVRFSSIKEAMSAYLNFSKQPIKDEGAEPLAVTLAFFQTRRKD